MTKTMTNTNTKTSTKTKTKTGENFQGKSGRAFGQGGICIIAQRAPVGAEKFKKKVQAWALRIFACAF